METYFAPSERKDLIKIKNDFSFLKDVEYIDKLINSLPYIGAILNKQRQVVFANKKLLELINIKPQEIILGQRPGEILHCVNSKKEIGGCGTSKNCSVCGAANSILEAQKTNKIAISECRISAIVEEEYLAYDFKVSTAPFEWNKKTFYLFSLIDISSEKRRQNLEKIFFHDIMNKAGSLYGFIDLLKMETDTKTIKKFINLLDVINNDLISEIKSQRELSFAESGDLNVHSEKFNSLEIINSCASQIKHDDVAKNKEIIVNSNSVSINLISDSILLKRIVTNMLKNALEATTINSRVEIGCNTKEKSILFWVKNNEFIPPNTQLQIFQRSFSTKGLNRGLGTYSMKLLGENYLKGKVDFTSTQADGTKFFIELPLNN